MGDSASSWEELLGPFYDADTVRQLLAQHRRTPVSGQDVIEDRGLLALTTRSGEPVYPAFQFGDPLVADGVAQVVELLPADLVSPWMVAAWLASADVELNGARPIDVIADGGIARVLAIAAERATALDLVPQASLEQIRRWQQIRARLLATPVLDYDALAELRHDPAPSATRIAVSRQQTAHQLFTVTHNGEQLIPAFQLTEDGAPRPELAPILGLLIDGGVDGWQLWLWLTAPTPYLSGEVPNEVAATEPNRALQAARRFIDNGGDEPAQAPLQLSGSGRDQIGIVPPGRPTQMPERSSVGASDDWDAETLERDGGYPDLDGLATLTTDLGDID